HDGSTLFRGAPRPLHAGRYHSLVVDARTLPRQLKVSARTKDGIVMALRHLKLPVFGVQFHPESILTPDGQTLLRNFLEVWRCRFASTSGWRWKAFTSRARRRPRRWTPCWTAA